MGRKSPFSKKKNFFFHKTSTMKAITLYDYLMWIAESEKNINSVLIADQLLMEDMNSDEIMAFYEKHKRDVLENYKEEYPTGKYRGMDYYDTKVSFDLAGKHFELTDVNGSFLHDYTPKVVQAVNNIARINDELRDAFDDLLMLVAEEKMNGRTVEVDGEPLSKEDIEKYMGYLDEIRKFALFV